MLCFILAQACPRKPFGAAVTPIQSTGIMKFWVVVFSPLLSNVRMVYDLSDGSLLKAYSGLSQMRFYFIGIEIWSLGILPAPNDGPVLDFTLFDSCIFPVLGRRTQTQVMSLPVHILRTTSLLPRMLTNLSHA